MSRPFLWIVGGVLGLGLIVWMAFAIASEPGEDIYGDVTIGWGDVTVDGEVLPPHLGNNAPDESIGMTGASFSGSDWRGNSYSVEADGRPKVLMLMAHWCSHCQAEAPKIQAWVDAGRAPTDVDLYTITTLTNPTRVKWPPQNWLESEGWTLPVIMDDDISTLANTYGLSGTPFYVVLDGDNEVLFRISGEIGVTFLEDLIALARAAA